MSQQLIDYILQQNLAVKDQIFKFFVNYPDIANELWAYIHILNYSDVVCNFDAIWEGSNYKVFLDFYKVNEVSSGKFTRVRFLTLQHDSEKDDPEDMLRRIRAHMKIILTQK